MPATTVPTALRGDKALTRQVRAFDDSLENADEFVELMKSAAVQAPIRKEMAVLRQRMKMLLEPGNALQDAAKQAAALAKDAAKLVDRASEAVAREVHERYVTLWTRARALLAQALVEVGAIEPLPLRMPMQKEQAELRARLDRIEKDPAKGLGSVTELQELLPQIESFMKRLEGTTAAGQWMRSNYLPLMGRVRVAIQRVPAERCRKTLLAELDFVEADTRRQLARADTKVVAARAVPHLQRIEKVAAQVVAAAPSVDREFARLAKLLASVGPAQPGLTRRLKALIQARATTWPAGADLDGIIAAMPAFDAEVAKLASEIEQAVTAVARA
jgi:predicted transcriptional regulator